MNAGNRFDSGNCNDLRTPFTPQPPPATYNATLRNLTISSHSSAIKFEQIFQQNHSAMRDMLFEDIRITNSSRGIGFQQRTGAGDISNITFRRISIETRYPMGNNWWGSGEPIWLTNVNEGTPHDPPFSPLGGSMSHIFFEDVEMRGENAVLLSGLTHGIGPVHFTNISLTIGVYGNVSCAKGNTSLKDAGCKDYRSAETPLSSR